MNCVPGGLTRRAVLAFPFGAWPGLAPGVACAADAADSQLLRRLRFSLQISNPLARTLLDQRLWCYLPANLPPGQRLVQTQVSAPHRIHSDALGHCIAELRFARFPAFAHKIVDLTASVAFEANAREPALTNPQQWLGAERAIESEQPQIALQARALAQPTQQASARAIFEWVRGHMRYTGYLAQQRGALYALQTAEGDCTEYADLVVALCRALAIPARMVGGHVLDRDSVVRAQDYHNWAQVFWDQQWHTVDAQKGNWLEAAAQYAVFRISCDVATNPVGLEQRFKVEGELVATL